MVFFRSLTHRYWINHSFNGNRSQHNPSSIRVTLGDYILHSEIESLPHEVFTVSEVKLHPNFRFTPQADRYDVAVLVLDRSVQYRENIMPICLPPKDTIYIGRMSYVAGWGALQAGMMESSVFYSLILIILFFSL